ncbi:MAG: hypothetical protein HZY73_00110 [Micropruina sp.]|nr:MAG: hypothetical protein HZY73_00110 [Micropruina sp.]
MRDSATQHHAVGARVDPRLVRAHVGRPVDPVVSGSPSVVPTQSSPAAESIVLGAKAVGTNKFGTAEATVEAYLTARLGKADDSHLGKVCELDTGTPYGRQLGYSSVYLFFESAPKGTKTSPRKLSGWLAQTDAPLPDGFMLDESLPLKTTYADLKKAFPGSKLDEIPLGESAFYVFTTPSGIWYRGEDDTTPDQVGAGPMRTCE